MTQAAPRIVITGMGVATAVAISVEDFWRAAVEGRSGLRKNPVNTAGLPTGFVVGAMSEEHKRAVREHPSTHGRSWLEAPSRYALEQALADAGNPERRGGERWAAAIAEVGIPCWGDEAEFQSWRASVSRWLIPPVTTAQAYAFYEQHGAYPDTRPSSSLHADLATRLGGPVLAVSFDATCASGIRTFVEAARVIQLGCADIAVAVASSTRLTSFLSGTYAQMGALSRWTDPPEQACKPFDRQRDGMVPGEGGAAIVIESEEHAARRGAPRVYAALLGSGFTTGGAHPTQPDFTRVVAAIQRALATSGVDAKDIDAVNAHGTSTRLNDLNEAKALHEVFGPRLRDVGLSAVKSIIGHTSHASGLVETIIAALTLQHGIVPGIPSCLEPDPECDMPVSRTAVSRPVRYVIKDAFGFGAQYGSIVLGHPS